MARSAPYDPHLADDIWAGRRGGFPPCPYDEPGPRHSDAWMALLGWSDSLRDECIKALEAKKGTHAALNTFPADL